MPGLRSDASSSRPRARESPASLAEREGGAQRSALYDDEIERTDWST